MSNGKRAFSPDQAEQAIYRYYLGETVHDIIAEFGVNPYRLYMALRSEEHPRARGAALERLRKTHPQLAARIITSEGFPCRPQIRDVEQPDLFQRPADKLSKKSDD